METKSQQIAECMKAEEYVRVNANRVKIAYGDRYIAVRSTGIVDSDTDEFELAARIERYYPNNSVLIGNIERILNPEKLFMGGPHN